MGRRPNSFCGRMGRRPSPEKHGCFWGLGGGRWLEVIIAMWGPNESVAVRLGADCFDGICLGGEALVWIRRLAAWQHLVRALPFGAGASGSPHPLNPLLLPHCIGWIAKYYLLFPTFLQNRARISVRISHSYLALFIGVVLGAFGHLPSQPAFLNFPA